MKLVPKAKEGASVGDAVGAGVGDLEGRFVVGHFKRSVVSLSVGCTVKGGFVCDSVGAFVALENHSKEE